MKPGEQCQHCKLVCGPEHAIEVTASTGTTTQYVDPCLGHLPGVAFACCGHGKDTVSREHFQRGYIAFENGTIIYLKPSKVLTHEGWTVGNNFGEPTTEVNL